MNRALLNVGRKPQPDQGQRGQLKQLLLKIGWPAEDLAGYVDGTPHPIMLDESGWKLRPAMKWTAPLVGIREIPPYTGVGYGQTWRAPRDTRIGLVPVGYADGYPRHATTGTPVLVNGQRARIVGRVSMDMISVDISDIPEAYIGSPVTLWGEGLSADEVGAAAGTLSYELLCKLTARVPVAEVS